MIKDELNCSCKICEYGRRIADLAGRQTTWEDKNLIRDMYESFAAAEDDNGLYRGRWKEVKPYLHLLRRDHFLVATSNARLEGHERCEVCGMLERVL